MNIKEALERSYLIDEKGILLDDDGNELRDEEGEITIIPKKHRNKFKVLSN